MQKLQIFIYPRFMYKIKTINNFIKKFLKFIQQLFIYTNKQ